MLLTWTVPVRRLHPAEALAWLTDPGESDARLGASVGWLRDLARFASELVERGRFLPTVARHDEGPVATSSPAVWTRGPCSRGVAVAADVPLEELMDSFYQWQGELPGLSPAAVTDLLDQVPEVALRVRGRPLVEALGPVYRGVTRS